MQAIQFNMSVPRYALGLGLRKVAPALLWRGVACVGMREVEAPSLPSPEWVRIRTRLGGICGSDLNTIRLHVTPYFSPFSSSPFTLGHENVGVIDAVGADVTTWQAGDRVVVEPTLWCRPRGFADVCEACAGGETNRCTRVSEGDLAPGLFIGSCRDTGGSWSRSFVAHQSQLYAVPSTVSDENALMVEPFACGLHAVLQALPGDNETVLIIGAGTIGLVTVAALRALGSGAHVVVATRYPFQAALARRLGADTILLEQDVYAAIADLTGATLHSPLLGKPVVVGGVDHVFECVGSDDSVDDALRLARTGGAVTLVGVPGMADGIDWTAIFLQELTVRAAFIYHHAEQHAGRTWRTFDLALALLANGVVDLAPLVTHRFALDAYHQALSMHLARGRHGLVKGVFAF